MACSFWAPSSQPQCGWWVLPIAAVLYPAACSTSASVVSLRGRPPSELMAKLWVTPLRRPRRPVSREARDGEQVEAAEWKSTNLENEWKINLSLQNVLSVSLPHPSRPTHSPLSPRNKGLKQDRGIRDAQKGPGWGCTVTLSLQQPTHPNVGSPSSRPSWPPGPPSPDRLPG